VLEGVVEFGFSFSFADETDWVLVSALYITHEEALVSWGERYSIIDITLKYPALFLFPPKTTE